MEKGFFASLFDLKFETYITKRVASVMYAIITFVVLLATAGLVVFGFANIGRGTAAGAALVFLAPLAGLLILTTLRVAFETSIALVDIAMNTKKHD